MAYQPQVWVDDVTEIDEVHMRHIEEGIENAYNVSLIAISDTAPSECSTGDKYYNTTTKKIYVATATDTWSVEGETPLEDIFYVLFDDNTTYAWDGEDLISVGGGGSGGSSDIVIIGDETNTTEDTKLLVDTSEQETTLKHKDENSGTFVDTLSAYVNKKIMYDYTIEQKIGKWVNNKPIYRKVIDFGTLPTTASAKYVNHNISNLGSIVKIDAIGYDGSSTHYPIPFVPNSYMYGNTSLALRVNETEIGIAASGNTFSGHTAIVILEYTKTTD